MSMKIWSLSSLLPREKDWKATAIHRKHKRDYSWSSKLDSECIYPSLITVIKRNRGRGLGKGVKAFRFDARDGKGQGILTKNNNWSYSENCGGFAG